MAVVRGSSTVLVVDDHAGFRKLARALLDADGFDVVGEAADGRSAVVEARRLRPDIVLLDVQRPDADGFDVARDLLRAANPPEVVLISSRDAMDYGSSVVDSGARGFLTKSRLSGAAVRGLVR